MPPETTPAKTSAPFLHMVCNAHLDPVWLWEWDEGVAEALATFRSAADICEDNPALIFNHNEVILYEWVEEHDPALFERIRRLVGPAFIGGESWDRSGRYVRMFAAFDRGPSEGMPVAKAAIDVVGHDPLARSLPPSASA